jgi:signal transduction histidine kinase
MSPLRYAPGSDPDAFPDAAGRVQEASQRRVPLQDGSSLSVPLINGDQLVAVLVAECLHAPEWADVQALDDALSAEATKLYAALLFSEVRDAATSDERQRLAREVHDGIAQDVASLGYLVDSVLPQNDDQAAQLADLRSEVSRVVGELRHSVFDLRTEVGHTQGLGESLHALAGHVGSTSSMTVHVTIDESPDRLRSDVEAHLFRIAQEAMNNARKHSGAANVWLSGMVNPPLAEIEVRDDGAGLGKGRPDSHGLKIMRERAEQIGATLEVISPNSDGHGTRVRVSLPGPTR